MARTIPILPLLLVPVGALAQEIRAREGRETPLIDGDRRVSFYFMTADTGPTFHIRGATTVEFIFRAKLTTSSKPTVQVLISVDGARPKTYKLDFGPELKAAKAEGRSQLTAQAAKPVEIKVPAGLHIYELRFADAGVTGFVRAQEQTAGTLPDIVALAGGGEAPDLPDLGGSPSKKPAPGAEVLDLPDLAAAAPPAKKAAADPLALPDLDVSAGPTKPDKSKEPAGGALDLPDLAVAAPPKKGADKGSGLDLPDILDLPPVDKAGKGKKTGAEELALPDIPDISPAKKPGKAKEKDKVVVAQVPTTLPPATPPRPPVPPLVTEPPAPPPGPPPPMALTLAPELAMASSLETATGNSNSEFAIGASVTFAWGAFRAGLRGGARFYTREYYEPSLAAFTPLGPMPIATAERRYEGAASVGWRLVGAEAGAGTTLHAAVGFQASIVDSMWGTRLIGPTGGMTLGMPLAPNLDLALGVTYAYNVGGAVGTESVLGAPRGSTTYHAAIVMKFPPAARVRLGYSGEAMAQAYSNRLTNGLGVAVELEAL